MIKFWGVEEVGNWLESLGLAEYKERFAKNDIQGEELLGLDRNDLKVCNISTLHFSGPSSPLGSTPGNSW